MVQEEEARHTPEAVREEIRVFEERASQFLRGEITEESFRPFRLKHGIYGQRQSGRQMVRVKIPSGILNPEQLRALAHISETYSNGRAHLTTRENCQFHFVRLETVPAVMRLLADVGLTTREACGSAVRNVTCCPLAGVCPNEAFDVTPYALATTRFFLRHPELQDLPRKFKIAFSGCPDDGRCTVAGIQDIGLIARIECAGGTARRGFRVLVGGGLGSLPTAAQTLTEFLPEEELIPTVEAILRVFYEHGNRRNKLKARMKFVLREKGIAEFRRLVEEKRALVRTPAEPITRPTPIQAPSSASALALQAPLVPVTVAPAGNGHFPESIRWAEHNLQRQRQPGYGVVWIKLPSGTLLSHQLRGLAALLERHKLGALRTAISQGLLVPWIPLTRAREIYRDLQALDLATPGARTIADVTACPGATTCNLGITRSLTLGEVLAKEFAAETDQEVLKIRIKISGCPNACGQHHIADIGLYGNARRLADKQAPFYQVLVGGEVTEGGVRFARQVIPVPAKRIPQALRALIDLYLLDRAADESFAAWAERTPDAAIIGCLRNFTAPSGDTTDLFVDWGDQETFSLQLGRGECAV